MGVRIKIDDLNPLCEGCCDDLIDDYELKIDIETRLDFNFFDYRGDIAQRRGETNIYKEVSRISTFLSNQCSLMIAKNLRKKIK